MPKDMKSFLSQSSCKFQGASAEQRWATLGSLKEKHVRTGICDGLGPQSLAKLGPPRALAVARRSPSVTTLSKCKEQTGPHVRNASKRPIQHSSRVTWLIEEPFPAMCWHSTPIEWFSFVPLNQTREQRPKKEGNNCRLSPIQSLTANFERKEFSTNSQEDVNILNDILDPDLEPRGGFVNGEHCPVRKDPGCHHDSHSLLSHVSEAKILSSNPCSPTR